MSKFKYYLLLTAAMLCLLVVISSTTYSFYILFNALTTETVVKLLFTLGIAQVFVSIYMYLDKMIDLRKSISKSEALEYILYGSNKKFKQEQDK